MNISTNSRKLAESVISLKGLVWILGKLSLVAAVGFARSTGVALMYAEQEQVPTIDISQTSVESSKQETPSEDSFRIILTRNIFGVEQDKSKGETPVTPASPLKLRLVATNVQSSGTSYAIIEDTQKQQQDVFAVSDKVFDQAKLVEIHTELVKVDYNGKIETLKLDEGATPSGGTSSSSSEEQTQFSVKESELNDALANLPRLLSQARAVPYFRNGQSIGMRLFAIRRDSLYEKLGLKNGDIIKSINDNNLADPAQALKLFEQLRNERSIYLTVERSGEDVDLRYSID